jgi:transposase
MLAIIYLLWYSIDMFIKACKRIKNGKTYTYYQIVQSYRQNGSVKHKIIANLGNPSNQDIDSLIKGLKRLQSESISIQEAELKHKEVLVFGEIIVLDFIWNKLDISSIISLCADKSLTNVKFNITPYIKLMTIFRLIKAGSELQLTGWFKNIYFPDIRVLEYHKLIRSLGYVIRIKPDIEKQLFEKQKDLFHLKIDIVFYDITSTYFESHGPAMAKKGYSRDKRNDRNQVLIALAITKEGFPIGHEVLEGNRGDKDTVKEIIDMLEKRFHIDTCIFVGDRGMVTEKNITYIKQKNYRYIFALRRRRLIETKEIMEEDIKKYKDYAEYDIDGKMKELKYYEIVKEQIRYLICYNPERAKVDLRKLEEKIEKMKKQVENIIQKTKGVGVLVKRISRIRSISRFYEYGIDKKNKFYYRFNEEGYNHEKLIAGKFVLKTNECQMSSTEIIIAYKNLCKIESAFRDMKDFLEIRPIYHQTEKNVKGHIFIVVLGYLLEKVLENYFHKNEMNRITAKKILKSLSELKLVVNDLNGNVFGRATDPGEEVKKILNKVGIKKNDNTYFIENKEVVLPEKTIQKLSKYDICSRD